MREIGRETRRGDKKRVSNRKDDRKEGKQEEGQWGREKKKGIVRVRINEGRNEKERRGEKEMFLEQAEKNKKKIIFHMDYSLVLSL